MINALSIDVEEWFHICGIDDILKAQYGLDTFGGVQTPPFRAGTTDAALSINPEQTSGACPERSRRISPRRVERIDFFKSRVQNNTTMLLEVLKEYNVRATFFVLGSIAQEFPELIKKISDSQHEIASHSYNHFLVYRQTREDFSGDLRKSIDILSRITRKKILGFRAPEFSIVKESLWALDVLKGAGIKYDCSIFPISHPRYGIPGAKTTAYEIIDGLIEFPPSTVKILGNNFPIAGGAYFRILPYSFTKNAIRRLNAQDIPANIYLHPWEIDYAQPRLKIPLIRRFTHYTGLKNTLTKLRALLSDFKFAPISEVLGIEGSNPVEINLQTGKR